MKTGDIILFSGKSKQAIAIQKFQKLQDIPSGKWNHSGLLYISGSGVKYVIEANYIQQRKLKAAVVMTPLDHYMNSDYELMLLSHKHEVMTHLLEVEMFKYIGTPYSYLQLVIFQPIEKVFNKWLGRKNKADKRLICHEYSMTVWNNLLGYFPEGYQGNVKDMWNSDKFEKIKI